LSSASAAFSFSFFSSGVAAALASFLAFFAFLPFFSFFCLFFYCLSFLASSDLILWAALIQVSQLSNSLMELAGTQPGFPFFCLIF